VLSYLLECSEQPGVPVWPLFVHVAGGIIMLGASTCHHTFRCCSAQHYATGQRCDYSGIAVMIAASCTPPFYYGFICQEVAMWRCIWIA
jgi:predicted membrane channel-forming protein YqfA (hemolysin III family)